MKHFLALVAIALTAAMTHAQLAAPKPTPAFHADGPVAATKLPPILTEKQRAEQGLTAPAQKAAYAAAAKVSSVVYQMPCYCYCDRNHGHASLRSCFEGTH
jgi:Protein of unknown function with PCYCGC motif